MQRLPPQSSSIASDSSSDVPGSASALAGSGAVPASPAKRRRSNSPAWSLKGSLPVSARAEAFTHDARNLLTALGLYADLLNAPGVLPQHYRHYASEIRLLADRSSSLLGRVFLPPELPAEGESDSPPTCSAGSRNASAGRTGEPLCDPATVLRRFLPLLRAQTEGAAEVVLRLAANLPPLPVSGEALERITANLVCNAAQAMCSAARERGRSCGTVWISLQARDGVARLTVEDSGPGMATSMAAAFLRPKTELPPGEDGGRGWGHRIVHGLVTETGGRLAVRPRPAGGTVVTVRWPLTSPSAVRLYSDDAGGSRGKVVIAC